MSLQQSPDFIGSPFYPNDQQVPWQCASPHDVTKLQLWGDYEDHGEVSLASLSCSGFRVDQVGVVVGRFMHLSFEIQLFASKSTALSHHSWEVVHIMPTSKGGCVVQDLGSTWRVHQFCWLDGQYDFAASRFSTLYVLHFQWIRWTIQNAAVVCFLLVLGLGLKEINHQMRLSFFFIAGGWLAAVSPSNMQ